MELDGIVHGVSLKLRDLEEEKIGRARSILPDPVCGTTLDIPPGRGKTPSAYSRLLLAQPAFSRSIPCLRTRTQADSIPVFKFVRLPLWKFTDTVYSFEPATHSKKEFKGCITSPF